MAYKVIILYQLYMPSYFLGTFTEYPFIDRNKHLVLASAHPSPLSAYNGFFGNKHFSRTNEYLQAHGQTPIEW